MLCDMIAADEQSPNGVNVQLLQQWYKKDDNSIQPIYVLQTISSILTNFNNKVMNLSLLLVYSLLRSCKVTVGATHWQRGRAGAAGTGLRERAEWAEPGSMAYSY